MVVLAASPRKAAELLSIPPHIVRGAIRDGQIPARRVGIRLLIEPCDLLAWFRSQPIVNQTNGVSHA